MLVALLLGIFGLAFTAPVHVQQDVDADSMVSKSSIHICHNNFAFIKLVEFRSLQTAV